MYYGWNLSTLFHKTHNLYGQQRISHKWQTIGLQLHLLIWLELGLKAADPCLHVGAMLEEHGWIRPNGRALLD